MDTTVGERDIRGANQYGPETTRGYWRMTLEHLARDPIGMIAGVVILWCIGIALTAPLIGSHILRFDPVKQNLDNTFAAPGGRHILGTDELGRDTFIRLLYGAQVSVGVGLLSVLIAGIVGTGVGVIGGFYGGIVDDALMRVVDLLKGLPAIYVFIFMSILFRPNVLTLSLIIAFVGWANVARLVRGEALIVRHSEFVAAAVSLGATRFRMIFKHVLPHVLPTLLVATGLGFGQAILIEAALDFLGLGIAPPTPSWGNMLQNAQSYFAYSWTLVLAPGVLIFVTVLAAAILGNALRDAFDPKLLTVGSERRWSN
ncbi:MAG TPA: ABC transporter permease [bacterium]|nr:ABC transporter permease [bacterium]